MPTGIEEAPKRSPLIRFGDFSLDRSRRTLSRFGIRLKLQRQPFQVLELLILRAPAVVSRDEIRRQLWGDDVNVDTEQSINFCIRQIRSVLADSATAARFVETVPREGYRFIAKMALPVQIEEDGAPIEAAIELPPQAKQAVTQSRMRSIKIGAFATVLLLLSVGAGLWLHRSVRPAIPVVAEVSSLTNYPGDEREPSFSPDGRQVAFSWDGERGNNRDIYITLVGEQQPLRLTSDPAMDAFPAWSPDGKQIAFVRFRNDVEANVMLIPALGGPERVLYPVRLGYNIAGTRYEISGSHRVLAWSPDGKYLAFTNETSDPGHYALFLLSLASGNVRPLFRNLSDGVGDTSPAFSADGQWLAYAHLDQPHNSRIFLQRLTGEYEPRGAPQVIPAAGGFPQAPVWMPDSKSLLFLDRSRILRAEPGGTARSIYGSSLRLDGLTITGAGPRLVSARSEEDDDLWMLRLRAGGLGTSGVPERILYSSANEVYPRFSPDGQRLVFCRSRNGVLELWLADRNGENPRQLTHLSASSGGSPNWSPDGKFIALFARLPEDPEIYVIRAEDGTARQVTRDKLRHWSPSWSGDGRNLYFERQSLRGGPSVLSVPVEGGTPRLLWEGAGIFLIEVPGRNLLVYGKDDQLGLFARSLAGDPSRNPELHLANDYLAPMGGLSPFHDGVYYVGYSPDGLPRAFRFYSFQSGKSIDIAPAPPNLQLGMTVSPDRSRLIYAVEKHGGQDLVQLELK